MFRIEQQGAALGGLDAAKRSVVDVDRSVALQRLAGLGPFRGTAMVLVWEGRRIPFEQDRSEVAESSSSYFLTEFQTFGASGRVATKFAVPAYTFSDDEEKARAQLLAVEALLVFGGNCDGLSRPNGYNRVEFEGRQWVLSDFGYDTTSEAGRLRRYPRIRFLLTCADLVWESECGKKQH